MGDRASSSKVFVSATDTNSIHDNVSGEIAAISEKTTPVSADVIIIEDSADSNNKKKVQVGNLSGSGDMTKAIYDPTNINSSAFAMDNMVEGTTTKILTSNERANIVTNTAKIGVTDEISNVVEDTTPQLGGNLDIQTFNIEGSEAADFTKLAALTATSTELNYVDGVTSAIQTQLDSKLPKVADVNAQTGTTYTLVAADNGKIVTLSNASAITVTVPSGLGSGFNCTCIQIGAGTVSFTASSTTINNRESFTDIAGQYGAATLVAYAANIFLLQGDLA